MYKYDKNNWTVWAIMFIIVVSFMLFSTGCEREIFYCEKCDREEAKGDELLLALDGDHPVWDANKLPPFTPKFKVGDLVRHRLHGVDGLVVEATDLRGSQRFALHDYGRNFILFESAFKEPYPESKMENRVYTVRFAQVNPDGSICPQMPTYTAKMWEAELESSYPQPLEIEGKLPPQFGLNKPFEELNEVPADKE